MREVTDFYELESIGRGISSAKRNKILSILKEKGELSIYELSKLMGDDKTTTVKNHCRVLADEGLIEIKRKGARWTVKLKRIPHVYIEELE